MIITIHRGATEIGGTALEIQSGSSRLIIDMGMPLNLNGEKYDRRRYKELPNSELIARKILPDIKGLYHWDNTNKPPDAVLISHPHIDHYGFLEYLHPDIPICLGEAARKIMDITVMFTPLKGWNGSRYTYIKSGEPFHCAAFKITPYLMDHSGFDAYAFLIEAGGKKIIYTGDFRGHGRKANAFNFFLNNAPVNTDAIIMEGTMMGGRLDEEIQREEDLEHIAAREMKQTDGITLIYSSSQNIDRLVTFYKAAKRAGRTLVVDLYTAIILDTVKDHGRLPHPSKAFDIIRVFYPWHICNTLEREDRKDLIYKYAAYKIDIDEIAANRENIAMMVRPALLRYLKRIENLNGGLFIYSLWEGYLREEPGRELLDYIKEKNLKFTHIHTSGHAGIADLKKTVNTLKPKNIIPIHTENPENYKVLGDNILKISDGAPYEL